MFRRLWDALVTPSTVLATGTLLLMGFLVGVLFWGGFNTAVEVTNRQDFCISCHEMYDNVYQELQRTVHYSNRSGVRASCSDCHVPHDWTFKMARKMQASKEVWGALFGTINTPAKFEEHRARLAKHEWARLKSNDSLECRNCHTAEAMDVSVQESRAQRIHEAFLFTGERTCIDCHKGIAHNLPNMQDIAPGWTVEEELQAGLRRQGTDETR